MSFSAEVNLEKGGHAGFTLIELIACVAIAGLLFGYAIPGISHLVRSHEATTAINWMVGNVVFARHSAIVSNTLVTLCPSRDGTRCGGKWHEGTLVFTDMNGDREVDGDDKVLRRLDFPVDGATIKWRSFGNRQYLQMRRSGFTNYQNGNFVYCPADGDLRYARQLVINVQGRGRTSKDTDGDGLVEDRRGRHLRC